MAILSLLIWPIVIIAFIMFQLGFVFKFAMDDLTDVDIETNKEIVWKVLLLPITILIKKD